ncbi:ribosome hibernation-promoting factor, HPF/YfiA family [Syntrophothermus lipocalidus]|uniref:Ribosome hibernation promoting factor n=1 Tax=Syntrophothermus lipocalidus (strain DSM 12680 / TGB-C1) TaxID=643648 RepID=D7CPJ8_SYNLT|nr:ribosome-associated translation inhibitor RaiA [Syntrophothermus lipocalidus]ADI02633.1 ribosomal subunit interface protein [Syntrophothermus lipocalidus DSM 12680]HOV42665.1 ribosome-associated translation inhibitor RaiA [Syntrophothermus lipocalidus]
MRIEVRGKNIELTDALREYVEKRLSKLERFIDDLKEAQVTLSVEGDTHRVEVTIPLNGVILRGEEKTDDMYSSVDLVVDKLEKQIDKYKTRIYRRYREVGLKKGATGEAPPVKEEEKGEAAKVVRTKRFALKPMDVEEAIMQMNLLGHSFFVFFNVESAEVNVLYRRRDGNYGLIEPEFE